jgi:hypothetical protein
MIFESTSLSNDFTSLNNIVSFLQNNQFVGTSAYPISGYRVDGIIPIIGMYLQNSGDKNLTLQIGTGDYTLTSADVVTSADQQILG